MLGLPVVLAGCGSAGADAYDHTTVVSIEGDQFHINGAPTYGWEYMDRL